MMHGQKNIKQLVTLLPSHGNISYDCHRTLLDMFFCS